ncbi:MAG TPA: serine/threonine-protein kinase [Planctomycetota bacterium]|nr:serine/threonine-protein kinase [Planctomycetota bacterium]
MSDAARFERGSSFRGLRIHGLLGEGAMGAAYLASHPVLRMPMVIKVFRGPDHEQILREATLASRVRSAHVVDPVDAGLEQGVPFLIQRYVDGVDLDELRRSADALGWPLPVPMVARMTAEAARGLHAVHQAGVVHRDVKPSNLFLRGDGICCVGDFGIAVDRGTRGPSRLIAGTPMFMAPEQWLGKTVDRRTDVYSLGATAHLMATGEAPFPATTRQELKVAHVERPYARPAGASPEAAYFFAVLERALEKDPARRYPTAESLAAALDAITQAPLPYRHGAGRSTVGGISVFLEKGDLSRTASDVIVSASNSALVMDGGVSAALKRVGGRVIEDEALRHGPVPMGSVVWTQAGTLAAKNVAHAVAALDGAICLQRCTLRVLLGAEERWSRSVAFPALGTGIGEVPMSLAAHMMLEALRTVAAFRPRYLRKVRFVLYDESALRVWRDVLLAMGGRDEPDAHGPPSAPRPPGIEGGTIVQ